MKKAMAILAVLAAAAVICGLLFFHNDVTDRFNPFIHQQDVYVQIDRDGRHLSPGGTEYTLDGYNASGKKEEVTFFAGKDLRKNAYLKVKSKGKYVETWEEVRFEDMPDSVQSALK
ncbi:YxeA family protein [Bacillus spizizenii]|uniref:YxeA family protein n=1 Tax=Bacillus spizizenii TaxID=96241 RepID=UPI0005C8E411|nr:YxeA family protein [Bacillus spizizenii]MCY7760156.1 YxeA family protein [Bacillus spizizenii]MCY7830848.1 YxeA family protein [Bacillus spizizenii]MCY8043284.1 YxeA family protein [Bacillus spizizenii]MCY8060497.1 YxeA family protein [Bacillus spizizenii]MCY8065240.1 YxeA family protein [Bacillus spizizenii]